ncbi:MULTISPECIES: protein kinase domain-containing protein [Vibrio]|uniref:protein kinase domain-containing protein n=1 Tax=Vibrio TaxID=662 RepID=UPI00041DE56A|nr:MULTISPECIES: phosphotransferase [Vibrio]
MKVFNNFYKFEKKNINIEFIERIGLDSAFIFGEYFKFFNIHKAPAVSGVSLDKINAISESEYRTFRKLYLKLKKLHSHGYIHRDITPGNIVIGDNECYIIDWEHCCNLRELVFTKKGLGYPFYVAPYLWDDRYSLAKIFIDRVDLQHRSRLELIMKLRFKLSDFEDNIDIKTLTNERILTSTCKSFLINSGDESYSFNRDALSFVFPLDDCENANLNRFRLLSYFDKINCSQNVNVSKFELLKMTFSTLSNLKLVARCLIR